MGGTHHFHPSILKCLAFGYQPFEKRAFFLFHEMIFIGFSTSQVVFGTDFWLPSTYVSSCNLKTEESVLRLLSLAALANQEVPKIGDPSRQKLQDDKMITPYTLNNSRLKPKNHLIDKEHHLNHPPPFVGLTSC